MEMGDENPHDLTGWAVCSSGTLQELTRLLRAERRRRALTSVVTPLAIIAVLISGTWVVSRLTRPSEFYYGGMWCREVRSSLDRYAAGQRPDATNQKIAAHIQECRSCRDALRDIERHVVEESRLISLHQNRTDRDVRPQVIDEPRGRRRVPESSVMLATGYQPRG